MGILLLGGPSFNGGKSQLGLNFVNFSNEYPFLNMMKTMASWTYVDNSSVPTPDELDANGWPVAGGTGVTSKGGVYNVFYVPTQTERPGRYKIAWDGNGEIYTGHALSGATGSKISSTGSGWYEFDTTASQFNVGIKTVGSPAITNMRVFHVDDEVALETNGEVFGTKFKQRIAESKSGVLRFLDWQKGNTSNVSTWATRRPTTYYQYGGFDHRPEFWAGEATLSGTAYTAPLTPSSWTGLVDKATVIIKFQSSTTSDSATLNVAGTGDIVIRDYYGDSTASNTGRRPLAGRLATLVYDADLNVWLKQGGDTSLGNAGLESGVPPELFLQLCEETGTHPHVVSPMFAVDPMTDYIPSLATYFRDNGPSWMIPRFEGSNETWNSAAGFYQTRYGWNKAFAHWATSNDHHNWYGKVLSTVGQAVSSVYSDDRNKYWLLAGVQTGGSTAGQVARLNSTQYVAQAAAAQSGYTKSAAHNWATHVATAQYFGPAVGTVYFSLQELRDGFSYVVTNAGNPTSQAALADAYADSVNDASGAFNLAYVNTLWSAWFTWAQGPWGGSNVLGLTGYEGGYSPDYSASAWTSPITGATAANPCVLTLATTNNAAYSGISGNPAVVGMSLSIASVDGMTQLNGNTYTVTKVGVADGLAANEVEINVDASGFSPITPSTVILTIASPGNVNWSSHGRSAGHQVAFKTTGSLPTGLVADKVYFVKTVLDADNFTVSATNGGTVIAFTGSQSGVQTASYVPGAATYVNAPLYTNTLRYASKFRPLLQAATLINMQQFVAAGGVFPAEFFLSGPSQNSNRTGAIGSGQAWGIWDPSIWAATPSPRWDGIIEFNSS